MRELRRRRAKCLEEQHMLRRVRDVVVAADDMRNRHVHVVDDDGEMVRGVAIGPLHHEVLDVRGIELDPPTHGVVKGSGARRHLEADRARRAGRLERGDALRGQRQARAVVLPGLAALLGALALVAQPLG